MHNNDFKVFGKISTNSNKTKKKTILKSKRFKNFYKLAKKKSNKRVSERANLDFLLHHSDYDSGKYAKPRRKTATILNKAVKQKKKLLRH